MKKFAFFKSGRACALALCLAVVGNLTFATSVVAARTEYRIGALFATSGGAAMLGEPEKLAAEMVVEQINADGGVAGLPLKLVVYDTEGDPTKAYSLAKKLIDKDEVDIIVGPTTSGESLAIGDLMEQEKVPLISCAASYKIVNPLKQYVFKVTHSDNLVVERIFEAFREEGIKKVAFITVSNGFGDSGRGELVRLAPAYGLEVAADERYGEKDTDMTVQLTKIKGCGAQAIVCWGTNPGPAQIAKNRKQLGITIPLYNSHGVASKAFIEQSGGAAEGTLLPAGKVLVAGQLPESDALKATLVKFKTDYEAKFSKPINTFGGHAYDAIHLAARAIARAAKTGEATRTSIRDELEKEGGFPGVAGLFAFSPTDHNGLKIDGLAVLEVKEGDFALSR